MWQLITHSTLSITKRVCILARRRVPKQHMIPWVMTIAQYTPLKPNQHIKLLNWLHETYNVCALVAEKLSPEPMLAAAITWTAQPQSIEATDVMDPIVFASGRLQSSHRCRVNESYSLQPRPESFDNGATKGNASNNIAIGRLAPAIKKARWRTYSSRSWGTGR